MIVLLSAKAGLRAREIANLTWDMVLGPTGQISGIIELRDHATVHAATAKPRTPRSSGPNGTAPALRDFD